MNKQIKTGLIALLMASVFSMPEQAFLMDAQNEDNSQIMQYLQKFSKTAFYIETIFENITYVQTYGRQQLNAAQEYLSSVMSYAQEVQGALRFSDPTSFVGLLGKTPLADSALGQVANQAKNAADDLKSAANQVTSAYNDVKGKLDSAKNAVTSTVDKAKNAVGGTVDKAKDVLSGGGSDSTSGSSADAGTGATSSVASKGGSGKAGVSDEVKYTASSYERVSDVTGGYGAPQANKQAAQKFIKAAYYYSAKDGDKYEGAPLSNTAAAQEKVLKNRVAYQHEVMANTYGTAMENLTTVKEESIKRLEELQQKASSAKTIDDKKAVEALIVQEETRQRMIKLNLELAALERDLVYDMQSSESVYIIPRTAEQIKAETDKQMKKIDYDKPVDAVDAGTDKVLGEKEGG